MYFFYTKYQTPRGAMADAEVGDRLYLIKNVMKLRLTYQIKMLAYVAQTRGKKLVLKLPNEAKIHETLKEFIRTMNGLVKIERT